MPKRIYTDAHASARFMAPNLDPLDITKALMLPPDSQHRCGEPHIKRNKKGVVVYPPYEGGLWSMSSEAWVDSPRLETHLTWLLDELEPHRDAILSLDIDGLEADLFCFSLGATPILPSLPKVLIARADRVNFKIHIDHYDMTND